MDDDSLQFFTQFLTIWHADIRALNIEHASLTDALTIDPHDKETVERLFAINLIYEQRKAYRKQFFPTMHIVEDGKLRCVNCSKAQAHAMVGQVYE